MACICKLETQESWVKGLRIRGADGVNFNPRFRENEMRGPSSISEASKNRASQTFLHLFVLFRPSTDWMMPTLMVEDHLLSPPIQMLISSTNILDQIIDTIKKNFFSCLFISFSLLWVFIAAQGFLWLQNTGSRAWAQQLWHTSLVASWHMEYSQTRD